MPFKGKATIPPSLNAFQPPHTHIRFRVPEMNADKQKIMQDTIAALQRNDPALKKIEFGEFVSCSLLFGAKVAYMARAMLCSGC